MLEIPVLFETKQQNQCDVVVLVLADDELRRQRVCQNRGWSMEKIKKVESFYLAQEVKMTMSDYIVHNDATIADLNEQVAQILPLILNNV